jgi:uncharacterized protein YegL
VAGRGGRLARPTLPDGPLKDLNDALRELLRRAGSPSLRVLEADIRRGRLLSVPPSHSRIYDVFVRDRLPDCDLLSCLVQVIAERVQRLDPRLSPMAEGERFYRLWLAADEADRRRTESVVDTRQAAYDLADRPILPLYLVSEESASMAGEPIAAINGSIVELHGDIGSDPVVADRTRFCLIGFSNDAHILLPLSELSNVRSIPSLRAEGTPRYSAAFNLLRATIDHDMTSLRSSGYRVLRPAAFFLTASPPSDIEEWPVAYKAIIDTTWEYHPNILAFGFGKADGTIVQHIATVRAFSSTDIGPVQALREFAQSLMRSVVNSGSTSFNDSVRLVLPDQVPGFTVINADII